jgi:hypothetical protein
MIQAQSRIPVRFLRFAQFKRNEMLHGLHEYIGGPGNESGCAPRRVDVAQRHGTLIGHAHRLQTGQLIAVYRVNRNDVRMVQACQRLMFDRAQRGDFHHDATIAQAGLFREKYAAKGAAAQLDQQPKVEKLIAGVRKVSGALGCLLDGFGRALKQAVDLKQPV